MNKQKLTTLTALLLCAVLGANGAWAGGATFTPVSGEWYYIYDPEVVFTQWIDDDGILHIRDAVLLWTSGPGPIQIVGEAYTVFNLNLDLATGNGDSNSYTYYEGLYNGLTGTFAGHGSGTYTNWVDTHDYVHHGGGDFANMHSRGTLVIAYGSGVMNYDGVVHDANPNKDNGENSTWSDVKALYR